MYESGPMTTAGGTRSQMMYLREKDKKVGIIRRVPSEAEE
jgi:hypothetical protein